MTEASRVLDTESRLVRIIPFITGAGARRFRRSGASFPAVVDRGPLYNGRPYNRVPLTVKKRSVSIKDVARAAGVSYSTVSRALRGSELVEARTRQRVVRWAEKLDYTANSIARGLVTRRTRTIGL